LKTERKLKIKNSMCDNMAKQMLKAQRKTVNLAKRYKNYFTPGRIILRI